LLTEYAAADPGLLAELILDSDHKSFARFIPVAEGQAQATLPLFQAALTSTIIPAWNDTPRDTAWTGIDPVIAASIESGRGLYGDRFAICQTMPLADLRNVAEGLRNSGYRPVRLRPYADGPTVRVAAVWARDGRRWRIEFDKSDTAVVEEDGRNQKEGFIPVDVAGFTATDAHGKPVDRYAALWVERASSDDDVRMYLGKIADEETAIQDQFKDAELIPRTLQAVRATDGRIRYCGIWGLPVVGGMTAQGDRDLFEANFAALRERRVDYAVIDVSVNDASHPPTSRERIQADHTRADNIIKLQPGNLDAMRKRALANLRLGEPSRALEDLNSLIGIERAEVEIVPFRAIAHARLRQQKEALKDLERFQKAYIPERAWRFLAVVVAAELGDGFAEKIRDLEVAVENRPQDSELRYETARALSLASQAVGRRDQAAGRQLADRAIRSLKTLVRSHDADFGRMDDDLALDPIRDEPEFAEIVKDGRPERRYAAVWTIDPKFQSIVKEGLDPAEQLHQASELIDRGYRPVAWSAARTNPDGPLLTASVWRVPVFSEGKGRPGPTASKGGAGVGSPGSSRRSVAALAAQRGPAAAQLHYQLVEPSRCRCQGRRGQLRRHPCQ
jgi:tetratricopeptide (TPR) repeat protein